MSADIAILVITVIGVITIKVMKYLIIKNATRVCGDCKNFSSCGRFKYYYNKQKDRNCLEHPACKEFQEGRK